MGRYLVMYDLSGIQGFIFQTNRLKEIAGASYLVSKAFFSNIPELAGEKTNAWKLRKPEEFGNLEPDQAIVVYIGGGNALVLFGGRERARDFTKALKRKVFLQTAGALRVCSASIEIGDEARLADCLDFSNPDSLRSRLDRSKSKAPLALTARGFSINRLDNESYEPILYFEEAINDRGKRRNFLPRNRRFKLEEYARQHSRGATREYTSPLLELHEGREFEVEFDGFFKEEGSCGSGKYFLAVVHIDGNTMGQRIAGFLEAARNKDQSFEQDLSDMRDLSVYIGDSYKNALTQMIDCVYGSHEGALPFRPVVADGDDITFICRSEKAFECFNSFVFALHEPRELQPKNDGLPKPSEFSVGCGIALVKSSYPFSSAYEIAEELCKNAKRAGIERLGLDIEASTDSLSGNQSPISSVDFHVCAGELVGDIAEFRERYLVQNDAATGENVMLCARPYHLGIIEERNGDSEAVDFSLASFLRLLGELQHRSGDSEEGGSWIARSKLKRLRDKYGEGVNQARLYGQTIIERDVALQRSGAEGGEGRNKFIGQFEKPFISNQSLEEGRKCLYARFFDALDVIDLCEGAYVNGAEQVNAKGGLR